MFSRTDVEERSRIRFEGNQCIVSGRAYSTEHVVLVKPSRITLVANEEGIKLDAEYVGTPRLSTYGNYIVIGVSADRYIPSWDSLEGKIVSAREGEVVAEGEIGLRGSGGGKYVTIEIVDRELKPIKTYGREVIITGDKVDFVNVLGSHYRSFYVKTKPNSRVVVKKLPEERVQIDIS